MRISLLQCFSVDTSRGPRMETASAGGSDLVDRKYLSAPTIPSFFRENHFPFFASGPRNASWKGGSSLSISCLRHTRHVCLGTSRRTYVPLMKNPVTMAEGPGDSDTNFRRSAAPPSSISNISSSRNEEFRLRNSPLCVPSSSPSTDLVFCLGT